MRGLRVLEINPSLSSAYCGHLFAVAGADVVCLEPRSGAALRQRGRLLPRVDGLGRSSSLWEYLGAATRSVTSELDDPKLEELVAWAELVISDFEGDPRPALELNEHVRAINPRAVHTVTSGYGLSGPYSDWRYSSLTQWAAGGHLYLTGEPDREPVQGGGPWPEYLTGATAAVGSAAAVMAAARTGKGQMVDVGAMESMAALHQWTITMYTHLGYVKRRWGNLLGESTHPIGLYQCADGWISIVALAKHQWESLCITMELWDLLADASLMVMGERFDRAEEIDAQINAWLSDKTVEAAVKTLQGAHVPASPLATMSDALAEPHLDGRDFWAHPSILGPQAKMPWRTLRVGPDHVPFSPAPRPGQHNDARFEPLSASEIERPHIDLSKVRVLEFGVAWAGPLAGRFLGDLGADVVKVEHPLSRGVSVDVEKAKGWHWGELPHPQVRFPVFPDGQPGERWWNRMGTFNKMNRSKRSLCLDAKADEGKEILHRLIETSDIVLHNYSPRGATSLGIDAAALDAIPGHAISLAMTGYGITGPLSGNLSYGPVLQAAAGYDEATGYENGGPIRIGVAFPDAIGGVHGSFVALCALWERCLSPDVPHVDLSQLEAVLSIAGDLLLTTSVTGINPVRHGNRSETDWPQGVYRCSGDDRWVALTVRSDDEWAALAQTLGPLLDERLHGATRVQRRSECEAIDQAISQWTARSHPGDAARLLQAAGIAAFPVVTNEDLVHDPHLADRGFIVTWDQPDVGPRAFPGFPIHFEETEVQISPCPTLGADNAELLAELGYSPGDTAELTAHGILAERPSA